MIVIDASAAVDSLQRPGTARSHLADLEAHAPHLIDAEVVQTVRRQVRRGEVPAALASSHLLTWGELGIQRHPSALLLRRVWEVRENLSAYDAHYVALAELLGCPLLTRDRGIARSPGIRCQVELLTD